jgi:hypothetical protein
MLFRRTHPQERISSAHFGVSHDGATDLVHEVKQIQGSLAGAACTEVGFLSQSTRQGKVSGIVTFWVRVVVQAVGCEGSDKCSSAQSNGNVCPIESTLRRIYPLGDVRAIYNGEESHPQDAPPVAEVIDLALRRERS